MRVASRIMQNRISPFEQSCRQFTMCYRRQRHHEFQVFLASSHGRGMIGLSKSVFTVRMVGLLPLVNRVTYSLKISRTTFSQRRGKSRGCFPSSESSFPPWTMSLRVLYISFSRALVSSGFFAPESSAAPRSDRSFDLLVPL